MTPVNYQPVDVLVIGAGNAASNAALAAHEAGCSVAMLETAPESARGGNSAFTGGAFRFVYEDVKDLLDGVNQYQSFLVSGTDPSGLRFSQSPTVLLQQTS